ncbi:hypothetical protein GRX03_07315 [Halovenus sp. WSH3]|uniref:DUF7115 domain-containing protein n=1 Tax=Halovenus carboxidivorans TaxID=2692199 RepID=A0A6B0T882_9EURY|nr:hypothetical protein [Halovenus carboxidivorans]MXR51411.1 hypothetical protein [Halovenus carboxidivorans]
MEIPDRIAAAADGETIQSAVSLGDDDVICFTPTRTLLYRGEGLLSDESVDTYSHDIERLNLSEGRRKTTFALEYVDSVEKFKVASNRADQVLSRLLTGVLRAAGVIDEEEAVAGVFLFSELTLVVTDSQLLKHVGAYVWDPDFEEYAFEDVTGLEFEEGSVATQVVISVGGRPQRIKAPSDEARRLRQTLTNALFAYHDVDSLEALNKQIGQQAETDSPSDATGESGLGLDENISPLVGDDDDDSHESDHETAGDDTESPAVGGDGATVVAEAETDAPSADPSGGGRPTSTPDTDDAKQDRGEELERLREQVETLTEAVEAQQQQLAEQSEEIQTQRETIEQLIEELRRQT